MSPIALPVLGNTDVAHHDPTADEKREEAGVGVGQADEEAGTDQSSRVQRDPSSFDVG